MSAPRVSRQAAAVALTLAAGFLRLVTNAFSVFNFNPMYAGGTFGGARVRGAWGFVLPFAMWVGGDLILYALHGFDPNYRPSLYKAWFVTNLICLANLILIGRFFIGSSKSWGRIGSASVLGCVQFFVISNFGSFLSNPEYAGQTWADLVTCYVKAIEFAGPSLLANVVFTPLWFAVHEALTQTDATAEAAAAETTA